MTAIENNFRFQFLEYISMDEKDIDQHHPLAASFVIAQHRGRYLICFNRKRNQWELPAGKREPEETPKECATRELYEETGQKVTDLDFKGVLTIRNNETKEIKYHAVYFTALDELHPFIANNETTQIKLWLPSEEISSIDPIDLKLLELFN